MDHSEKNNREVRVRNKVGSDWQQVDGSFDVADDLLWQANNGRLAEKGDLLIKRSGRIGPLVEMVLAARQNPAAYTHVSLSPPFCTSVEAALSQGVASGSSLDSQAGVFPLNAYPAAGSDESNWALWGTRAEQAAKRAGFSGTLPAQLLGALGELKDNVFEHSGDPESGLVAYGATNQSFEFVVADAGMGVLASLKQNPQFSHLSDAGAALRAAASDGVSRRGSAAGNGYGIGQVFRALASYNAQLRFRSDDYVFSLWGNSPSLTGQTELAHKGRLKGLTISVLCEVSGSKAN